MDEPERRAGRRVEGRQVTSRDGRLGRAVAGGSGPEQFGAILLFGRSMVWTGACSAAAGRSRMQAVHRYVSN
jgi:hypothetical protein